jgi:FtsX-like permease family
VLVTGQLLARQSFLEADDFGTLRALGMSFRQLLVTGLARAALIGAAGAGAATVLAIAVSPLFPVGLARIAEPYPGIRADGVVAGLGAMATVLATVACAVPAAWRAAGTGAARAGPAAGGRAPRRSSAAAVTGGIGLVSALLGIRLAVQPGAGRTAVPIRSTIASAVVGVAALTAAIVFSASLGHLLASPRLYGVTWDADVQNVNQTGIAPVIGTVARDPQVAGWATAYAGAPLEVDGVRADVIAISPGHGSFLPTPTEGHLPRTPGQIALGARTLRAIRSHVGAAVTVSLAGFRPARLTVVGAAVFPTLSDRLGLGSGSVLTVGGLRHLLPRGVPFPPFDTLLVRFRPRAGVQAGVDALAGRVSRDGPYSVSGPATPTDLVNFGRVQDLPFLLGMALGLLALVTIVHLLLTAVRRRRRDFAILRVIGLTRGQVRAVVSWQAATLAGAALVIGIPAGVLLGRAAWRIFAGQLGILPVVTVPGPPLAAMAGIALAVAVAAAALPGESAARTVPATILRSE